MLGQYLQRRRHELQRANPDVYSLRLVAQRVGTDPGHLSRIESGQKNPSLRLLRRLADELGDDVDALAFLMGEVTPALLAAAGRNPHAAVELVKLIKGLPPEKVEEFVDAVRQVRDGKW